MTQPSIPHEAERDRVPHYGPRRNLRATPTDELERDSAALLETLHRLSAAPISTVQPLKDAHVAIESELIRRILDGADERPPEQVVRIAHRATPGSGYAFGPVAS